MIVGKSNISIEVNGKEKRAEVEDRMLLVHFLREAAGLTGTHIGCDSTNCGSCTVLLDGRAIKSCTLLAVQANGRKVTTIEGISENGSMHPIQEGFLKMHGLQCGFCTPGMVMSAYWLLKNNPNPSEEEIKRNISGNLCRCTGYDGIINSVKYAAEKMKEAK